METIELNQQELISLYNNANDSGKKLLENKYGKETFVKPNIMDRVKTAEQAFAIKGISIASIIQPNDAIDEVAYKVLKVIVEILNEGWVPDWKNNNQYKYYPWFDVSSGSGEIRREEFTNFIEARKRFTDLIRIHAVSTSYMAIEWEEKHAEGGATVRGEFMINPVND